MHISHFIRLSHLGGVELLFASLADAWQAAQIDQSLLLASAGVDKRLAPQLPSNLIGIDYKRPLGFKLPSAPLRLRCWALEHKLSQLPRPDAYLSWSNLKADHFVATARRQNIPYVHYEHGVSWLHDTHDQGKRLLAGARGIICISQAAKRMLELKWQVTDTPIIVVPNPARPPQHRPTMYSDTPSRPPLDERTFHIGLAGRLIAIKGAFIAIEALYQLRRQGIDAVLHLAGEGPLAAQLRDQVRSLGIEAHVHFHGFVDDIGAFFAGMDIALCPSLREPFGLVSLEAAMQGCPVIVSRIDGLPETIKEGITGLSLPCTRELSRSDYAGVQAALPRLVYDPDRDALITPHAIDPRLLATTLATLYHDPARLKEMGQQARFHAQRHYPMDRYAAKLARCMSDLVA